MAAHLHFEAPTALEYFATLVADDASLSALEAALAIAQDDLPGIDAQGVLAEIDALAERLRRRIPADAVPLQRVRLLNHYFFRELGFAGNVNDYYDRRNSYLPEVLSTRRGIPITLALLYIEFAGQIGLHASGVSFPGHFLVKLRLHGGARPGEVVIDPFDGRSLARGELEERLAPYRRDHGLADDGSALALFLQSATPRAVVARLLRNLKEIHQAARDLPRLLAVLHRLVILLPGDWRERRDRALVLADLGRHDEASTDLAAYLAHEVQAEDIAAMRERLARWQRLPGVRRR
ncbi:MAG: tetratricopeptide repeat protein [Burkholderiales bacterium]|nr:tetratricopeptide repeat protein [Burkholderiales bacterium]